MTNIKTKPNEEKKKEEVGFFFLFTGLVVSLGYYLWSRNKKEEPGVIIPDGSISLVVKSALGGPITEGLKQNQAIVTVQNNTIKQITHSNGSIDNVPVTYTFQVDLSLACGDVEIGTWSGTVGVPADSSQDAMLEFDIPFGLTGTGICTAQLRTAEGEVLGSSVSVNFTIEEVPVTADGLVAW